MSYEEACNYAATLRSQGSPIQEITDHLADIGYTTEQTKQPPSKKTVTRMIKAGTVVVQSYGHSNDEEMKMVWEIYNSNLSKETKIHLFTILMDKAQ